MTVSERIKAMIEKSSWVRRMFEEGALRKKKYGAENVFDFSLGNPNLEPPVKFREILMEVVSDGSTGNHGYMPNAGFVETRQAVADINAISYDVPVEWGQEVLLEDAVWNSTVFGCVGYADGKPVSTATTLILEGIRYVGLVATLPEFRRRGYAETAMRHSLERALAVTGIKRTVLHATPMGKPSYERMGYRSLKVFSARLSRVFCVSRMSLPRDPKSGLMSTGPRRI